MGRKTDSPGNIVIVPEMKKSDSHPFTFLLFSNDCLINLLLSQDIDLKTHLFMGKEDFLSKHDVVYHLLLDCRQKLTKTTVQWLRTKRVSVC